MTPSPIFMIVPAKVSSFKNLLAYTMKYIFNNLFKFLVLTMLASPISLIAWAVPSSEINVTIITPFKFAKDAAPQNVLDEMNIDIDLPKLTLDYFNKRREFKSTVLSDNKTKTNSDIYILGEILHVDGGNGASRYFSMGFGGKGSMAVGVKVYDRDDKVISESVVLQNGARASIFSVFSNKKVIYGAMRRLPAKIFEVARVGNLSTAKGTIRALESNDSLSIQKAALSAGANNLLSDQSVTDAMEVVLLKVIDGSNDSNLIDGAAWCAINLGSSENTKYIASLENVLQSNAHKKIKKHAKEALEKLRN